MRHSTQTRWPSRQGPTQKGDSIKIVSNGWMVLLATMNLPTLSFLLTMNGRHWSWFWWTDWWTLSQDDTRSQSGQEETWLSPHSQQEDIIISFIYIRWYLFTYVQQSMQDCIVTMWTVKAGVSFPRVKCHLRSACLTSSRPGQVMWVTGVSGNEHPLLVSALFMWCQFMNVVGKLHCSPASAGAVWM